MDFGVGGWGGFNAFLNYRIELIILIILVMRIVGSGMSRPNPFYFGLDRNICVCNDNRVFLVYFDGFV